jgi:enoyl-CoA hydratase/carnithine racemase
MMETDILLTETTGSGIHRLILNDIPRRNALSTTMLGELKNAVAVASSDDSVRVIVIAANGPAFSAGHDLKEIQSVREDGDAGRAAFNHMMELCSALMQSIVNCSKPVIAEVHGVATAAGCQLVASCDLAIAADVARFATPGVNIGLFCSTPMVALSRNVANKQAMEMLLTGEMINAEKAVNIGLVNKMVPEGQLSAEVSDLAETIAAKPAKILAIGKSVFYAQREMDLAAAYAYTSEVMVENMLNSHAEEGVGAFLDKRTPDWPED